MKKSSVVYVLAFLSSVSMSHGADFDSFLGKAITLQCTANSQYKFLGGHCHPENEYGGAVYLSWNIRDHQTAWTPIKLNDGKYALKCAFATPETHKNVYLSGVYGSENAEAFLSSNMEDPGSQWFPIKLWDGTYALRLSIGKPGNAIYLDGQEVQDNSAEGSGFLSPDYVGKDYAGTHWKIELFKGGSLTQQNTRPSFDLSKSLNLGNYTTNIISSYHVSNFNNSRDLTQSAYFPQNTNIYQSLNSSRQNNRQVGGINDYVSISNPTRNTHNS